MTRLLPDPTFYPTPALAAEAPPEGLAYVALLASGENGKTDDLDKRMEEALGHMDVPTKADIHALSAKIAALTQKVDELKKHA